MTSPGGIAYSYVRFSTPEQGKKRSRERQEADCIAYCNRNELRLATEPEYQFLDAGRSAWQGDHLSENGQLARFHRLVEEGTIARGSTLIVESLDRLDRRSVNLALPWFMRLLNAGIRIVTLKDERVYEDGRSEDLIFSIFIFARANDESSQKARRLKDAFDAKRRKAEEVGQPMGHVAPKWLRLNEESNRYEPIPELVAVVERIFDLTIAGYGKNSIAKLLNADGTPTLSQRASVKGWGTSAVHHVVMNKAVLGEWQPMTKTEDPKRRKRTPIGSTIKNYFPQIISEEVFTRAQAAIGLRRKAQATKQTANFNVWQKIAKCIHCGSAMHIVNKGRPPKGQTYLVCSIGRMGLCGSHKLIRLDHSEQIFRLMLARLDMRALVMESAAKLNRSLEVVEGQLLEKQGALASFSELMDDPATRSKTLGAKVVQTEAAIATLESERARLFGELAAEDSIGFDTFMARLNLSDRDGRSLANTLLQRHSVLAFVGREGFIVTEAGEVKFGLAYRDGRAGYLMLTRPLRPKPFEGALHEAAALALRHSSRKLRFGLPEVTGPMGYAKEDWAAEDYNNSDERPDTGSRLDEAESSMIDTWPLLPEAQPKPKSNAPKRHRRRSNAADNSGE